MKELVLFYSYSGSAKKICEVTDKKQSNKFTILAITAIFLTLSLIFSLAGCASRDKAVQVDTDTSSDESANDSKSDDSATDEIGEANETGETVEDNENTGEPVYTSGKIISVSAGNNHTMALNDKGQLWIWGDNYFGQIGDGNISTYFEPIYELTEGNEYEDLVDGRVRDIDNDVYTPKYIMDNVKEIYAREDSSFVITNDNKLYAWGNNASGQLGDGTTENKKTPEYIMDDVLYVDSNWRGTTIIIKTDNTLWIAGRQFGFGFGEFDNYTTPVLFYDNVKKAVFDDSHPIGLLILTADNKLIRYIPEERNSETFIFEEMNGWHNIVDISAITQQVYMLDNDGNVYGWGAVGDGGRLGIDTDEWWIYEPVFIASDIKKILHGCMFIRNDGTLMMWSSISETMDFRNSSGTDSGGGITNWEFIAYGKTPVGILENIDTADGRHYHFAALDSDGNVYTWGQNFYGQLGSGNSENRQTPEIIVFT